MSVVANASGIKTTHEEVLRDMRQARGPMTPERARAIEQQLMNIGAMEETE